MAPWLLVPQASSDNARSFVIPMSNHNCKSNIYFWEVFTLFCHWYLELTLQSMRPDYPSSLRLTPMVQPPIQALQMPMHLCDYTRLTYTTISSIWGEMTSNPILRQFSNTLWHLNTVRSYLLHCNSFWSSLIENWPWTRLHHFQSFCRLPKISICFFVCESEANGCSFNTDWTYSSVCHYNDWSYFTTFKEMQLQ